MLICVCNHLESVIKHGHGAIHVASCFVMKLLNTCQIHDKVDGGEHQAQMGYISTPCTVFGDAARHQVGGIDRNSWLATHRCQVNIICSDSEPGPWRHTLLQTPLLFLFLSALDPVVTDDSLQGVVFVLSATKLDFFSVNLIHTATRQPLSDKFDQKFRKNLTFPTFCCFRFCNTHPDSSCPSYELVRAGQA